MERPKPLILVILDGFGVSLDVRGNPVAEANVSTFAEFERFYPFTTLQASGVAVGLPWGEPGNSEVGHLTIGAGRVLNHHLPRIISSIKDGSFFSNEALKKAAEHTKKNGSRLHIAGLISSGSVHSYIDHIWALLDFTKREGVGAVYIHAFSDGKDAPPKNGATFLEAFRSRLAADYPHAQLATVVGRHFAMDRDRQWDRVRTAYELMTAGAGERAASIREYIEASYRADITDEVLAPAVFDAAGVIRENDAVIFSNFREDSMREITRAFTDPAFDGFERVPIPNLCVVTLTEYQKDGGAIAAFGPLGIAWPFGRIISAEGLTNLRIAESEKYAHVTYFFNGGEEEPFPGEERILIPSQSAVRFEEVPEMRAPEIAEKILENSGRFDVIIANLANADMVGHTGDFEASVKAVSALNATLDQLRDAVEQMGGVLAVTADHGNIEKKRNLISGERLTHHSTDPVPFYLVGKNFRRATPRAAAEIAERKREAKGVLIDVAPTLLELLKIRKPAEMTGNSLLALLADETK